MPLYANGTLIPENVANALTVNGVNITQVIANGVAVWTQSLSNITGWSGNSIVSDLGFDSSGMLFRAAGSTASGAWITTNADGTFTGSSTATYPVSKSWSITTSGSNLKASANATWVNFNLTTEVLSGGDLFPGLTFRTSGGNMAFLNGLTVGPYISLH